SWPVGRAGMLFGTAASNWPRVTGCSLGKGIGLARIGCKSLCGGDQCFTRYIELMGKVDLEVRFNFAKKRRHVARNSLRRALVEQTIGKLLRAQLLAIRRIHGRKD